MKISMQISFAVIPGYRTSLFLEMKEPTVGPQHKHNWDLYLLSVPLNNTGSYHSEAGEDADIHLQQKATLDAARCEEASVF